MLGPSELGSHNALLEHWGRSANLARITVPTLTIGGQPHGAV